MNLSEQVLGSFSSLTDEKAVNNVAFGYILRTSFDILLRQKTEDECLQSDDVSKIDVALVKQLFASLFSIILEAAKLDADAATLKSRLEDYSKSNSRLEYLGRIYNDKKAALRKLLLLTTFQFPHITDVDWTLDYCIKSNTLEKIDTALYIINLKTEKINMSEKTPTSGESAEQKLSVGEEDIAFTCGVEELQDLVNKLKDALLAVKRF